MCCPIHNHSEYSALDGLSTVEEIAARVGQLGMCSCALTDHGLVAGHKPFFEAMTASGIKPILGLEGYQAAVSRKVKPEPVEYVNKDGKTKTKIPRDAAHVILLAKNNEGLRNLNILSDEANRTGYYYAPRMDWELLEKHREGLICTSACLGGLVSKGIQSGDLSSLDRYREIFREDFFLEIHTYAAAKQREVNLELVRLAQELSIPLVYANDAHYACEEDYFTHEMILCMQMANDYHAPKNLSPDGEVDEDHSHDGAANHFHPPSLYIMGESEVRESLAYLPVRCVDEAIANSDLIASKCSVTLPEVRMHMPVFRIPEHETVEFPEDNQLALLEIMERGLEERFPESTDEVQERAEYEYETLTGVDLGGATLGDYFLINRDWIRWANDEGILTGSARGSAGGSLLAYALGITHIDPIKYGLQFERFWNPGRTKGFPDIDTDVEQGKRGLIKHYLIDKYGADKVLSIGTHIRHQPKSAIESAARAWFGREAMDWDIVDAIKAIIETQVDAGKQPSWEQLWGSEIAEDLQRYKDLNRDWRAVFEVAERLTGRLKNYGIHASAVVVSDCPLPEVMPCRSATPPKGEKERQLVTQIDMHEVEANGFLKLDLLGLRNLDTLAKTAELMGQPKFDWWSVDYDSQIPDEGWQLVEDGYTLGLFQIEDGRAAKDIAKRMRPRSVEDLAAIVALNRPGPLRSGMVDRFLARRNGEEPAIYKHELLEDILKPTYGDFLYQEQIIAYFRAIGYSLGEADHIRKILGKKLVEKMQEEHPRYMERAVKFMSAELAQEIWDEIIDFSKYSFNKAHSVGYGLILGATIYAKS